MNHPSVQIALTLTLKATPNFTPTLNLTFHFVGSGRGVSYTVCNCNFQFFPTFQYYNQLSKWRLLPRTIIGIWIISMIPWKCVINRTIHADMYYVCRYTLCFCTFTKQSVIQYKSYMHNLFKHTAISKTVIIGSIACTARSRNPTCAQGINISKSTLLAKQ